MSPLHPELLYRAPPPPFWTTILYPCSWVGYIMGGTTSHRIHCHSPPADSPRIVLYNLYIMLGLMHILVDLMLSTGGQNLARLETKSLLVLSSRDQEQSSSLRILLDPCCRPCTSGSCNDQVTSCIRTLRMEYIYVSCCEAVTFDDRTDTSARARLPSRHQTSTDPWTPRLLLQAPAFAEGSSKPARQPGLSDPNLPGWLAGWLATHGGPRMRGCQLAHKDTGQQLKQFPEGTWPAAWSMMTPATV